MNGRYWKLSCLIAIVFLSYLGVADAKEVNWVAINPALKDATFVKDRSECIDCHETYVMGYERTRHANLFKYRGLNRVKVGIDCETCHGPSSKHLKEAEKLQTTPGAVATTVSFKPKAGLTTTQKSSICLQCHENGLRMEWKGGLHQVSGVSCDSCHYVMERRSDRALAINEDVKKACYQCHPDKKGQTLKASHMPLREGKMECSNCHNPHGSSGQKMLKTASANDTCYTCHAEKRGPFIWEHAVVRENCSNCHDPHGSNNPGLLNAKGPFLCLNCHQYGGHVNMPRYNRSSNPYGQGCVNCHNRIHGSNHPSGAKFTR
ncbi:MAG: DmsE family decaheme c-type cytochrome [Deltaproteobacteria bacterium]|nr:DmsE family decaheme c-type cytochrome [Deltaproteobacteria bacterium]